MIVEGDLLTIVAWLQEVGTVQLFLAQHLKFDRGCLSFHIRRVYREANHRQIIGWVSLLLSILVKFGTVFLFYQYFQLEQLPQLLSNSDREQEADVQEEQIN